MDSSPPPGIDSDTRDWMQRVRGVSALKRENEALRAEVERLRAEVSVLRGDDCRVRGDGPCGICTKCARIYYADKERLHWVIHAHATGRGVTHCRDLLGTLAEVTP